MINRICSFLIYKIIFYKKKYKLYFQEIYVFGDSHTRVFEYINNNYILNIYFNTTKVIGATAQGLNNPNSMTNALNIFKEKLYSIKNKKKVCLFLLGEVDIGFVLWFRAKKYNEPINKQLENSVNAYSKLLFETKKEGFENIVVMSIPLPTVKDNQILDNEANLRNEIDATQIERTNLTLEYNKLIKEICLKEGYKFLDLDSILIDNKTNLIKNKFIYSNKIDQHLESKAYSRVILNELKKIV